MKVGNMKNLFIFIIALLMISCSDITQEKAENIIGLEEAIEAYIQRSKPL